jgi:chromosome segregation ATPase
MKSISELVDQLEQIGRDARALVKEIDRRDELIGILKRENHALQMQLEGTRDVHEQNVHFLKAEIQRLRTVNHELQRARVDRAIQEDAPAESDGRFAADDWDAAQPVEDLCRS